MLRPDADLAARLARIRLVLMDIDGTLVTAGQQTFENVIVQLRKLKAAGIGFSIATGRTIQGASFVTKRLYSVGARLPPMITYNGAVVIAGRDSSLITRHLIERTAFEELVRRCRVLGLSPLVYVCGMGFDFSPCEVVYTEGAPRLEPEFNGMQVRVVEDLLAVNDELVAVLIEMRNSSEGMGLARELAITFHGSLRVTTSGGKYLEISHPLGTKLHAMTELARILEITLLEIMTVGDNFNDLEMIQNAGVGVAVANAPASVRDAAALRSTRLGGEGVVEALRFLTRSVRNMRPYKPAKTVA